MNLLPSQLPFRYQVIDNSGMMTKPWSLFFTNLTNNANNALTFTPDAFVYTNASGDLTSAAGSDGELLIGVTGSTPTVGTLTSGTAIDITNGPGSITITNTGVTEAIAGPGIGVSGATGNVTFTNNGVLSITGTANEVIASASTGAVTLSLPQPIALTSTPTFGGLTLSDLTQNGFLTIGASGLLSSTAAATNGQLLIGSSGNEPVAANITAGTAISVTNGAGSITVANTGVTSITGTANEVIASASTGAVTLSLPQAIATTSTPTFGGLTLTPLTGYLYGNGASAITASTTIPNTSITGLGTMSTQNANAVSITGGSINSTTIGATTTSTGAFTTLSASGNDALHYNNTNGQTISTSSQTTVTNWTSVFDRLGTNFNATTGVFTAPATGYYNVQAQIVFGSHTGAVNAQYSAIIVANASNFAIGSVFQQSISSDNVAVTVNSVVSLTSGQTLSIAAYQTSGVSATLTTATGYNYLSINRIP
jgi:hypothetical protein